MWLKSSLSINPFASQSRSNRNSLVAKASKAHKIMKKEIVFIFAAFVLNWNRRSNDDILIVLV